MKKQIFTLSIVTFFLVICTNSAFAQRDAGGSSGGTPTQPCPTNFVRNNGDGTCNGQAQIRLYFTTPPLLAPTLVNILYNGEPLLTNGYPIPGDINDLATKGYISYCLPMSNIPAAIKLTTIWHYDGTGQDDCVLSGTN